MRAYVCLDQVPASDGTCAQSAWVDFPESPFPVLSLADGAEIAFSIVGVWTLGVIARIFIRIRQIA